LSFSFFILSMNYVAKLNRDKHLSVKRLCCALHTFEPEFHRVTFSEKTKVRKHIDEIVF